MRRRTRARCAAARRHWPTWRRPPRRCRNSPCGFRVAVVRSRAHLASAWRRSMPGPMTDATDAQLAAQYEAFPYPQRDPRDEARRLVVGSPGHLREIDYWMFGARRPAARPLRALFAGGGTGDGTLMLAQQMATAGRAGSVTWLDRSAAALKIAQARAAARGLEQHRLAEPVAAGPARRRAGGVRLHRLLRRAAPSAGPGRGAARAGLACWHRAAGWG